MLMIGGVFNLFYTGGVSQLPKPGKYQLRLSKKDILVLIPTTSNKLSIPKENLISISLDYDVADKELSAGKAIAGGLIAGSVGAIAGASMGGKKVTPTLRIHFIDDTGNEQVLSLEGSKAEDAHKKMTKVFGL